LYVQINLKDIIINYFKIISDLLYKITRKLKRKFNYQNIISKFNELNLTNKKIQKIDKNFCILFKELSILNLSRNKLIELKVLPKNIYALYCYYNYLKSKEICFFEEYKNLMCLGLGYNKIKELNFLSNCNQIVSLDLSYNQLEDLFQIVKQLKNELKVLKHLILFGNCFTLLYWYRGCVLNHLSSLETFDEYNYSINCLTSVDKRLLLENEFKEIENYETGMLYFYLLL
jgi:Leucine-rich repeat (LRR) protein